MGIAHGILVSGTLIKKIYKLDLPLSWTQLEPHSEAVEQFLAMLRFEQKSEAEKLSEVLK